MALATDPPNVASTSSVKDLVVDACRHAVHVAHEARLAKSIATDAIEDGIHAARRAVIAVRRGAERLDDLKYEAAHRVREAPLTTVTLLTGVGFLCGITLGWFAGRLSERRQSRNAYWR